MNKPQFTPGPWFVDFASSEDEGGAYIYAGSLTFAQTFPESLVGCGSSWDSMHAAAIETAKANASLIAAAPELHAALAGFLAWIEDDTDNGIPSSQIEAARAAIAKATTTQ